MRGGSSRPPIDEQKSVSSARMSAELPRWRGVNHLALITNDMDRTVRFYHGVLGARLVAHLGNEHFRHYFFEVGPEQTVAFFEYRNSPVQSFAKPAGVPDPRAIQFDHLSLNLTDEHALEELQARLKENGSEVTDIVDHGFVRSIYFSDPNGIALEASWWVIDPTGRDADYGDGQLFSDPDPVPSVVEILSTGEPSTVPATHLVQEATDIPDPV
jgi:catechol 2,3-dioxygenase-like lactoylglutathione lyase family enzyme